MTTTAMGRGCWRRRRRHGMGPSAPQVRHVCGLHPAHEESDDEVAPASKMVANSEDRCTVRKHFLRRARNTFSDAAVKLVLLAAGHGAHRTRVLRALGTVEKRAQCPRLRDVHMLIRNEHVHAEFRYDPAVESVNTSNLNTHAPFWLAVTRVSHCNRLRELHSCRSGQILNSHTICC
jgi:hypothetical protein